MGAPFTAEGAGGAGGAAADAGALARLLFALGHVAMKTLVHIESCRKTLEKRRANGDDSKADKLAADLGGLTSAEEQLDHLDHLASHLVTAPGSLLGAWAPLVAAVCRNKDGHFDAPLRASASLCLCKLMCVSPDFCEGQLQLLFSMLKHEPEHAIRANLAIALGDLFFRHPNLLTPWTSHLYSQLRDGEPRVRKNVLMVLMHLVLNDMVKVQGQVAELALCLLDADERIASLAKLFWTEVQAAREASPTLGPAKRRAC